MVLSVMRKNIATKNKSITLTLSSRNCPNLKVKNNNFSRFIRRLDPRFLTKLFLEDIGTEGWDMEPSRESFTLSGCLRTEIDGAVAAESLSRRTVQFLNAVDVALCEG